MMKLGEGIEVVLNPGTNKEKAYLSMVQDIDDDYFIINSPMRKGKALLLHIGENVAINYYRKQGQYYFMATVIAQYQDEELHFFKLRRGTKVRRLQRRNFYRLQKSIPVNIEFDITDSEESEAISVYTSDIGGGGICIIHEQILPIGMHVKSQFELKLDGKLEKIVAGGEVVRCDHIDSIEGKYKIGISFIDISETTRDKIIKYVFNEQRYLRKRGLI